MVNWQLIGRATARYTIGYAGLGSVVVLVLTKSAEIMLGLMAVGLLYVAWAIRSTQQKPPSVTGGDPMDREVTHSTYNPTDVPVAKRQIGGIKALFTGIGLLIFGAAGMVVAPML